MENRIVISKAGTSRSRDCRNDVIGAALFRSADDIRVVFGCSTAIQIRIVPYGEFSDRDMYNQYSLGLAASGFGGDAIAAHGELFTGFNMDSSISADRKSL